MHHQRGSRLLRFLKLTSGFKNMRKSFMPERQYGDIEGLHENDDVSEHGRVSAIAVI